MEETCTGSQTANGSTSQSRRDPSDSSIQAGSGFTDMSSVLFLF